LFFFIAFSMSDLTILGRTNFRNEKKLFGITRADRRQHLYIIGKSGTGKSTLLETMIRQDIVNGFGVAVFDPHGDLVKRILEHIPKHRTSDVIYLNPADANNTVTFNPLASVPKELQALTASGLIESFKKIWTDFWGPRTEHLMRNAILALLEMQTADFSHILRILTEPRLRRYVANKLTNQQVKKFWQTEFESYPTRLRLDAIAPIQNKVGAFVGNPFCAKVLLSSLSSINPTSIINEQKILLINLAKGTIGEDTAHLLGSLLMTSIGLSGLQRVSIPESDRTDFSVYADEFQNVTTLSFANMLAELRKYRISLTLAHQHLAQLEIPVREAIIGNVGSMISFRIGMNDAKLLEQEIFPKLNKQDITNLPNYQMAVKLLVNGEAIGAFTGEGVKFE
jgi:type IV secretory pathway TraG/TraD family ATPase VirD4